MKENEFPTLSGIEFSIVKMLLQRGEMFGQEMVENSAGLLKRGTVYVTLSRMERKGILKSKEQPRPNNQYGTSLRLYEPTDYGSRIFKAQEIALNYLKLGNW